jgi:hypothetical protein
LAKKEETLLGSTATKNKCTTGKNHQYNEEDVCTVCGYENKVRKYWRTRKEKAPARSDKLGTAKTKQSIALLLSGTQSIVIGLSPELAEDALSSKEILMLADVMGDEINESPTLKRWIARAGKQSTHIRLVIVLVMILAPRLARRGYIPAGSENLAAAVSMAAGGSSDSDRGDELGEEHFGGGGAPDQAPIRDSDTDEDGPLPPPDSVSSANGHENGADVGEPKIRSRRTKAKV